MFNPFAAPWGGFAGNTLYRNIAWGNVDFTTYSGSNLTLKKASGAGLAIWADDVGAANVCNIDNLAGTMRFYNNAAVVGGSVNQVWSWTFGNTALIGGSTFTGNNIMGRQDQATATTAVGAGYVGEYIESSQATQVTLASGTTTEIGSATNGSAPQGITLTPGVWDITGAAHFISGGSTTVTSLQAWIGTATGNSNTGRDVNRNFAALFYQLAGTEIIGSNDPMLILPTWRVAINSTVTYYLKGAAVFGASTLTLQGTIRATRVA